MREENEEKNKLRVERDDVRTGRSAESRNTEWEEAMTG